jgi:bacteriocin biosynthesis cyclodehydratase domain-containing protein
MIKQTLQAQSVLCFTIDDFGSRVFWHASTLGFAGEHRHGGSIQGIKEDGLPDATAYVVIAGRPVPGICTLVEQCAATRGIPFVPITIERSALRVGPVSIPGQPGCWSCWLTRILQHAEHPKQENYLRKFYDSRPHEAVSSPGYLEPFALMASARLCQLFQSVASGQAVGGEAWQVDLMTRVFSTFKVQAVHDCPRCGLKRETQGRTYSEMRDELVYLWHNERS